MCFYCKCLWGCIPSFRVCTPALSDTAEEVCGSFSRCTELEEVLTRPQLCQICPNQTRGAGETQAAHRWDSKIKRTGREKEEGRHRVQHHPSDLVPDWGQEHGFQRLKKAVTTSRKSWGFHSLNDGLCCCFPCLIDLEGAFISTSERRQSNVIYRQS